MGLIAPHASDSLQPLQVNDDERLALQQYAKNLPAITLPCRETGDLVMLGIGGLHLCMALCEKRIGVAFTIICI